ncbi:alpha/beta hydrolase-fold protein [candidate division KSB1 bacterium]
MKAKHTFLLGILIFIMSIYVLIPSGVIAQEQENIIAGKSIKFYSNIYQKDIKLSVYLPSDYSTSNSKYPVFYTVQSYFLHNAGIVDLLSPYQIPEMIYVHLETYNSGDLIPTKIESRPGSGNADRFISFFKEELIPFIDAKYRTHPFRILHSNSWGGVFCIYSLLTQPEVFSAYIATVPWFIYDGEDNFMLKNAERFIKEMKFENNFLFTVNDNEQIPELQKRFKAFTELLDNNPKKGLKYLYFFWDNEDHYSAPFKAVYDALKWIFTDWRDIPEEILDGGVEEIKKYGDTLKNIYGYEIGINQSAVRIFASALMRQEKFNEAIALFKFNAQNNPDDPFVIESLGWVYENSGQLDLAKTTFETALSKAKKISFRDITRFSDHIERVKRKLKK